MTGHASALVHQCDHSGIETVLPFAIGSMLVNAGLDFDIENLVNSMPSDNTLQRCVEQNTTNTMILTRDSVVANLIIFLSADKGNKKVIRA